MPNATTAASAALNATHRHAMSQAGAPTNVRGLLPSRVHRERVIHLCRFRSCPQGRGTAQGCCFRTAPAGRMARATQHRATSAAHSTLGRWWACSSWSSDSWVYASGRASAPLAAVAAPATASIRKGWSSGRHWWARPRRCNMGQPRRSPRQCRFPAPAVTTRQRRAIFERVTDAPGKLSLSTHVSYTAM